MLYPAKPSVADPVFKRHFGTSILECALMNKQQHLASLFTTNSSAVPFRDVCREGWALRFLATAFICLASLSSAGSAELPAGTNLELRLLGATGSRVSHLGDPVQAIVVSPVSEDGSLLIPQGAMLSGSVAAVQRLGFGLRHCTASIELRFDSLALPKEKTLPVVARVLEVETAKERVNDKGVIGGIHPAVNLSSGFSIFISSLLMEPGIAVPVLGVKFLIARSPDPEIYFPPGTELIVQIVRGIPLPASVSAPRSLPHLSADDDSSARRLLADLPQQQSQRGPNQPSDLANVLLLGTQSQIDRAFHAAGWSGAHAHNAIAVYRMFHSVVQRAGYSMAPMTRLKMNGVPQQASYQKSLDTFAKRHHIRLWRQNGSDAWLSAASEDVSFTVNKMLVTHASDRNIDNERAKVVNDLAMTGCVDAASVVARDDLRFESEGPQSIVTDGKIAIIRLNDCTRPLNQLTPEHLPIPSRISHIAGVIARDFARSNPLSLSLNTTNMIVNREDARPSATTVAKTRQQRKGLAYESLISNRWKRQSVVVTPVSMATGNAPSGGR